MPMSTRETSLYDLVLSAVQSGQFDESDPADLVEFVRLQYLKAMQAKGILLPESSVDGLKTEIRDSLKTITYGFYSIKEYNQRRRGF